MDSDLQEVFFSSYRYTAVGYPDYVQYTAFVEEIESIFTLRGLYCCSFFFLNRDEIYFSIYDLYN